MNPRNWTGWRPWLKKYQDGEFNEDAALAASLEEYEARISALERKVGQLTMENDALKKAAFGRLRDLRVDRTGARLAQPFPPAVAAALQLGIALSVRR